MTEAVLPETPDQMSGKMSGKILSAVRSNPAITIPELAKLAGVSSRTIAQNLQNADPAHG